ncbi:hypothetical protein C2E19_25600 [Pseudomonas sp. DTU12.3]|nr:hypothetical protein C2E19_25600 [Pseudomonas sp. DTU12.3]
MGGILVGVLTAVRVAHQIQDLIIVVLPVCPVQAQSTLGFFWNTRGKHKIGMTGQTSGAALSDCGKDVRKYRSPAMLAGLFWC